MKDCNATETPLSTDAQKLLTLASCPTEIKDIEEMTKIPYREVVGSLIYASTCTRPDIEAAVGTVGKFVSNPGKIHWIATQKILRYLKGTKAYELTLSGSNIDYRCLL